MVSSSVNPMKSRKRTRTFLITTFSATFIILLMYNKSNNAKDSCRLSKRKSYGFFCESDINWEHRRNIVQEQEEKQISPMSDRWYDKYSNKWWQFNYEPNFSCAYEKRIGSSGDGGEDQF